MSFDTVVLCCVLQTILAYLSFVRHELRVRHLPHCIPFCYVSVGVIELKRLILWSRVLASETKRCFSMILDFLLSYSSICSQEQLPAITVRVNYSCFQFKHTFISPSCEVLNHVFSDQTKLIVFSIRSVFLKCSSKKVSKTKKYNTTDWDEQKLRRILL